MSSKTALVNAALVHLGNSAAIGNIETDKTAAAKAARNIYDTALESAIGTFNWPFARTYAKPGLVSTDAEDRRQWTYAYRYPADALQIRRIIPDATIYSAPHIIRPTYEIAVDAQGKLLLTNEENIRIEYTKRVTDTELFSPSFSLAFTYLLGLMLIPSLSGGDPFQMQKRLQALYTDAIFTAQVASVNEEQAQVSTDDETSEFTKARQ